MPSFVATSTSSRSKLLGAVSSHDLYAGEDVSAVDFPMEICTEEEIEGETTKEFARFLHDLPEKSDKSPEISLPHDKTTSIPIIHNNSPPKIIPSSSHTCITDSHHISCTTDSHSSGPSCTVRLISMSGDFVDVDLTPGRVMDKSHGQSHSTHTVGALKEMLGRHAGVRAMLAPVRDVSVQEDDSVEEDSFRKEFAIPGALIELIQEREGLGTILNINSCVIDGTIDSNSLGREDGTTHNVDVEEDEMFYVLPDHLELNIESASDELNMELRIVFRTRSEIYCDERSTASDSRPVKPLHEIDSLGYNAVRAFLYQERKTRRNFPRTLEVLCLKHFPKAMIDAGWSESILYCCIGDCLISRDNLFNSSVVLGRN